MVKFCFFREFFYTSLLYENVFYTCIYYYIKFKFFVNHVKKENSQVGDINPTDGCYNQ